MEPQAWEALSDRLRHLSQAAAAIAMGDLGHPIAIPEVEDPLTELSVSLELMRQDLLQRVVKLEEARGFIDDVIQSMAEGLMVVSRDGLIRRVNRAACDILGYEEKDLLWQSVSTVLPDEPTRGKPPDNKLGWDQHGARRVETTCLAKDGHTVPVLLSCAAIRRPEDKPQGGAVYVMLDMTEQKQMERQLMRAQRLEMAGRVAAQVAHDFNNLLGPLTGYPELIRDSLPSEHAAHSYCEIMLQAAQQMADINEDMMVLGRRGHAASEPLDVGELAMQVIHRMPNKPASLRTSVEVSVELRPVLGSRAQLTRVMSNLVSNAREAMHDDGLLTIQIENVTLDAPLEGYDRVEPGAYVRMSMTDSGPGIAPEVRDRVFDAFFTTKQGTKRRGCGLGLSVVQAIVADHGGRVELESEVGRGATFSVYLPAAPKDETERPSGLPAGGGESILVVDDDRLQREVMLTMLGKLGYRAEAVASGAEAVSRLREQRADLLILDMIMPGGMDGAETYRRALELTPGQRAVIVSGFAESDRVRDAQELGAGVFLRKPLTMKSLAAAVWEELARKMT